MVNHLNSETRAAQASWIPTWANHTHRFQAPEPGSQMVRFSQAASSHRLPSGRKIQVRPPFNSYNVSSATLNKLPFGNSNRASLSGPHLSCFAQTRSSNTVNMPQSVLQLPPERGMPSQRGFSFPRFVNDLSRFKRTTRAVPSWILVASRASWFQCFYSRWFPVTALR